MIHSGEDSIKQSVCPVCGAPAALAWASLTPWLCTNEECDVLGWDPYSTLEQNLTNAAPVEVIHNQGNSDEMPNQ